MRVPLCRFSVLGFCLAYLSPFAIAQNMLSNGAMQNGTLGPGGTATWTFSAPANSVWVGTLSVAPPNMSVRVIITRASDSQEIVFSHTLNWGGGGSNAAGDSYTITLMRDDADKGTDNYTITNAVIPGPPPVLADEEGGPLSNELPVSGSVNYGDLDVYWFNANASDPGLYVEMDYSGTMPSLSLIGPNGGISDNCGAASDTQFNCSYYNNPAGTIYAVVTPPSSQVPQSQTIGYSLTLHNSTAAAAGQVGKSLGGKNGQPCDCGAATPEPDATGSVMVGEPIDPSNGNMFDSIVDYTTAGQNPLALVRYYNSAANLQTSPFAASLGPNWRTNYDRYLHLVSPTLVTAERPDGRILTFRLNRSVWTADSDVDYRLTNSGSSWTLTDHNDTAEAYTAINAAEAQLNSITTSAGYVQTLAYSGAQLTTVTDSYSRHLGFTYTGTTLTGVTTPDTLRLTYGFDTSGSHSRLKTIGYNTSPATSQSYLYEDAAFPFALTGITDENGARFTTWGYDSQGRATSSQLSGGAGKTTVSYAADGFSTVVTGPLGLQETYKYQTLQDVAKIVEIDRHDPSGSVPDAVEKLGYDGNGYLNSRVDWNGNQTSYTNDAYGDPTSITEANGSPVGRTTSIGYDSTWIRKPHSVWLGSMLTYYSYDAKTGSLIQKTHNDQSGVAGGYNASNLVWNYTYTATGQMLTVQAPRTDKTVTTTYGYTGGTLTSITNPLGQVTKVSAYTPGGRPKTIVDPNNVTTTLTYSPRNWLLTRSVATAAGARTTTYGHDAAGNPTSVQQPGGATLTNGYDAAHRLTTLTDSFSHVATYTLDASGDMTATTIKYSSGTMTLSRSDTYDALGRRLTHTGGAGQVTHYAYDNNGNAMKITDPLGHPTGQTFDALNRLSQITDRAAGVTKFTYDANDNLLSVLAPNGASTGYVYDGFHELGKYSSPDSGSTSYFYDGDGNLTSRQDALNVVANYAYDALDRRISITYPASAPENVAYNYDQAGHGFGIGRLTGMTDQAGTFSRSYDERGNITADSHTHGTYKLANAYGYDAAGLLTSQTYPSGMVLTQSRDTMERIVGLTLKPSSAGASQTVLSGIAHAPYGPVIGFKYGNGITDTRTADQDYRLKAVIDTGTAKIESLAYTLNANDNVTAITDAVTAGNSQSLTYDPLDRLLTAHGGYGSESFGYDPNGNRTSLNGVANTYTPNTNKLAQIGTGTQTVTTNGNGNITAIAYATPMGFTYNNANRLATLTKSGGTVLSYLYDGFGQRIGKTDTIQRFETYDQVGRFIEQTDNTDTAKLDYIYLDGLPVATFVPNGATGTLSFLHTDRLGTPRLATNGSQAIGWSATTADPFDAPNAGLVSTIANDLRMPGQEFESGSGHNHNGWRDYAPTLGRYLESDLIGLNAGVNTYAYVENNPDQWTDRRGLDPFGPFGTGPINPIIQQQTIKQLPPLLPRYPTLAHEFDTLGNYAALGTAAAVMDKNLRLAGILGIATVCLKGTAFLLNTTPQAFVEGVVGYYAGTTAAGPLYTVGTDFGDNMGLNQSNQGQW